MTLDLLYEMIAKEILGQHPVDEDALALMILLHTHCLRLGSRELTDRPAISELMPITQRHAAEVLAAAWPVRSDCKRTDQNYWYFSFNVRSPFEVIEDVPPEWVGRVARVRRQLTDSGLVERAEPEE